MKKHLEVKTITHKGIDIIVEIDYDKGIASLVEASRNLQGKPYNPKNWVFSNRGLEYMNGWLNIIEAMKVAIQECKKDLEFSLAQSSKFTNKDLGEFIDTGRIVGKVVIKKLSRK